MNDYIKCSIEPVRKLSPQELKNLRIKCKMSQAMFASALGSTKSTIEKWEMGLREPSGSTLRLLNLIDKNPNILIDYNIITPLIEGDRY